MVKVAFADPIVPELDVLNVLLFPIETNSFLNSLS